MMSDLQTIGGRLFELAKSRGERIPNMHLPPKGTRRYSVGMWFEFKWPSLRKRGKGKNVLLRPRGVLVAARPKSQGEGET